MRTYTAEELAAITALPSNLGRHIGKRFFGRQYEVHGWLAHLEREVVSMLYRPGNEALIVSVPSQSGKSSYCSRLLPAWYLGRFPFHSVMLISYNESLAAAHGQVARNILKAYGPQLFGVGVDPQSDSASLWKLDNGIGQMISLGIRGGVPGRPADLVVADDTLAGAKEAGSPTVKKSNVAEWDGTISQRFQENTKVLIPGTRWAPDDIPGVLVERARQPGYEGIPVRVLNYKALAEPDPEEMATMTPEELDDWVDVLGRKYGDHLKGQHSKRFFLMQKASKPPLVWAAMYQGTPELSEEGMFPKSNWRFWVPEGVAKQDETDTDLPELVAQVRCWDVAASEGSGDYTVGVKMGRSRDNRLFVTDLKRFRHAPSRTLQIVKQTAIEDGFEVPIRMEQGRSGDGQYVMEQFRLELLGYNFTADPAKGDKESRATPWSNVQGSNRAYLPRDAPWLAEYIQEHSKLMGDGIGKPAHDDQIDASAYACAHLVLSGESEIFDFTQLDQVEGLTDEQRAEARMVLDALAMR